MSKSPMVVATKASIETAIASLPTIPQYGDCETKMQSFFGHDLLEEALSQFHKTLYNSMPKNKDGTFNRTHGEYHSLVKLLGYWVPTVNRDGTLHASSRLLTEFTANGIAAPKTETEANDLYHHYAESNPRLAGALRVYSAALFFDRNSSIPEGKNLQINYLGRWLKGVCKLDNKDGTCDVYNITGASDGKTEEKGVPSTRLKIIRTRDAGHLNALFWVAGMLNDK